MAGWFEYGDVGQETEDDEDLRKRSNSLKLEPDAPPAPRREASSARDGSRSLLHKDALGEMVAANSENFTPSFQQPPAAPTATAEDPLIAHLKEREMTRQRERTEDRAREDAATQKRNRAEKIGNIMSILLKLGMIGSVKSDANAKQDIVPSDVRFKEGRHAGYEGFSFGSGTNFKSGFQNTAAAAGGTGTSPMGGMPGTDGLPGAGAASGMVGGQKGAKLGKILSLASLVAGSDARMKQDVVPSDKALKEEGTLRKAGRSLLSALDIRQEPPRRLRSSQGDSPRSPYADETDARMAEALWLKRNREEAEKDESGYVRRALKDEADRVFAERKRAHAGEAVDQERAKRREFESRSSKLPDYYSDERLKQDVVPSGMEFKSGFTGSGLPSLDEEMPGLGAVEWMGGDPAARRSASGGGGGGGKGGGILSKVPIVSDRRAKEDAQLAGQLEGLYLGASKSPRPAGEMVRPDLAPPPEFEDEVLAEDGSGYDGNRAISMSLAGVADLNKRLNEIEGEKDEEYRQLGARFRR